LSRLEAGSTVIQINDLVFIQLLKPHFLWVRVPGTQTFRASGQFPGFTGLRLGNGAKPDPEAGNDENWPADAAPLEIADFELAAYPVTVAQFKPFVEQEGLSGGTLLEQGRLEMAV
jgi:formylglycine-generating enzyme required for sulfatase activity